MVDEDLTDTSNGQWHRGASGRSRQKEKLNPAAVGQTMGFLQTDLKQVGRVGHLSQGEFAHGRYLAALVNGRFCYDPRHAQLTGRDAPSLGTKRSPSVAKSYLLYLVVVVRYRSVVLGNSPYYSPPPHPLQGSTVVGNPYIRSALQVSTSPLAAAS